MRYGCMEAHAHYASEYRTSKTSFKNLLLAQRGRDVIMHMEWTRASESAGTWCCASEEVVVYMYMCALWNYNIHIYALGARRRFLYAFYGDGESGGRKRAFYLKNERADKGRRRGGGGRQATCADIKAERERGKERTLGRMQSSTYLHFYLAFYDNF